MQCEECHVPLWRAGEVVSAGVYVRVDDRSYRGITLEHEGPLPATFDGHIALYCISACQCREQAKQPQTSCAICVPSSDTQAATKGAEYGRST